MTRLSARRSALACVLCAGLAACAQEGDFGRRQPSVVTDTLMPAAGFLAAAGRGEPASAFMFTDDEKEVRDRAWHFILPERPRWVFDNALAELRRSRILPPAVAEQTPDIYYVSLMNPVFGAGYQSSRPPYRRLIDDMMQDTALLVQLGAVADRVEAADRIREEGLSRMSGIDGIERQQAMARIAENRGLVRWIDAALAARVAAYRYALQRLFIEIPEREAVGAEKALADLAAHVGVPGDVAAIDGSPPVPGYFPSSGAGPGRRK